MKGSLDTSILVQLITGQRSELIETVEQFVGYTKNKFSIADAALLELAFVLEKEKQLPRQKIATVFKMLEGHANLSFNRDIFGQTAVLREKYSKLSFYDCYLSAEADAAAATPTWTLNRKLEKQLPNAKLLE